MHAVLKSRCSSGPFLIAHQHRALEEEVASIHGRKPFALVKNPEDLTDGQRARLEASRRGPARAGQGLGAQGPAARPSSGQPTAPGPPSCSTTGCTGPPAKIARSSPWRRRCAAGATTSSPRPSWHRNGRVEAISNKIKVTVRMGYGCATPTTSWPCSCSVWHLPAPAPGRPVKARKKGEGSEAMLLGFPCHTNRRF